MTFITYDDPAGQWRGEQSVVLSPGSWRGGLLYTLHPIENVWFHLKQVCFEMSPQIETMTDAQARDWLIQNLPTAWERIRTKTIVNGIGSVPSRLQAVIDADGWHTKY